MSCRIKISRGDEIVIQRLQSVNGPRSKKGILQ